MNKLNLWQAYFYDGEDNKEWQFVSDGTRKDMVEEFQDVYKAEYGCDIDKEDIEGVYKITEAYDYTTNKKYKVILK